MVVPSRSKTTRLAGLAAFSVLMGSVVLATLGPSAAATSTSGAWIFPTSHRADALADDLDDTFYTGASENLWLVDSYFGDSTAEAADVSVDLYNPTSAVLSNVQVFVAISDLTLLTDIAFSGGESGDVSYAALEIGGGTPFLAGGASMDAHDIYPAYFVSYGVGDLASGSSNILSIEVVVNGDFASGLIVHLDYSAEDANGDPVTGPFEADMNIFEAGDFGEPPACTPGDLKLSGTLNGTYKPGQGVDIAASLTLVPSFEYETSDVTVTFNSGQIDLNSSSEGTIKGGDWSWDLPDGVTVNTTVNLTGSTGPLHLAGDILAMEASVSWDGCDGGGKADLQVTFEVTNQASGKSHSAGWWEEQLEKTEKGKKKAQFNATQADGFFQAIAFHSDVFTYGDWDGTAPNGDSDEGWLDISSLDDAIDILEGKSPDAKEVRKTEREALALWLNVASGALNLDTALEIYEKKHHCRGKSEFEEHTGLKSLSSSYDTVLEILGFAEGQISDWQDGHGASKTDLKLARKLAKAVNNEWLVAA